MGKSKVDKLNKPFPKASKQNRFFKESLGSSDSSIKRRAKKTTRKSQA